MCRVCGPDVRGIEERASTSGMATDMISLTWADYYDIAMLLPSDRDFVPLAEFLEMRGIKVIHGVFLAKGAQLRRRGAGEAWMSPVCAKTSVSPSRRATPDDSRQTT